jgi:hypothetical protein
MELEAAKFWITVITFALLVLLPVAIGVVLALCSPGRKHDEGR